MQTLTDVNFHIRKGQTTVLVDESGSGKSTVTDVVLALQISSPFARLEEVGQNASKLPPSIYRRAKFPISFSK